MTLTVRSAHPAEHAAVGELCVAAYLADGQLAPGERYAATLRDAAARAQTAELLVAVQAGTLLGTVTYVAGDGPLREIAAPDEAEFRMLAVAPEGTGRGVGTALARHVVELSRERGFARVVCSSLPGMTRAHRIYERLGFSRVPDRDWQPVAGVDLLAFALELRRDQPPGLRPASIRL